MTKAKVTAVLNQYYETGTVDNDDVWYDWFCKDSELQKRGKRLLQILAFFVQREKMDEAYLADKYVFFKNNCPMTGKLYDQVSICEVKNGNVLFCIQDQVNKERGVGVWVYSASTDFKTAQLLPF